MLEGLIILATANTLLSLICLATWIVQGKHEDKREYLHMQMLEDDLEAQLNNADTLAEILNKLKQKENNDTDD